jgi:formylglycine-generating enzyme required for sulfatase activity
MALTRPALCLSIAALVAFGASRVSADSELVRSTVRIAGSTAEVELVRVPGGTVELRGKEHLVPELWVGATEIPWEVYDVYLYALDRPEGVETDADGVTRPSKPYVPPDRGFGHAGYAAIGMTRHAAEQFCVWMSEKTGDRYRLPTEAEWIHLASAGSEDGLNGSALDDVAWHDGNSDWLPQPVGGKTANAFGLHDALGNVAEWVTSEGPPFAMGGSYLDDAAHCTPRSTQAQTPLWNASDPQIPKSQWWLADCGFVGFRVVREIEDATERPRDADTE